MAVLKAEEPTFAPVVPRYSLRPYQKKAVNETLATLRRYGRVLLHAPTGAGKTRMAMTVISMHLRENGPTTVFWLAPTKELVSQAAKDFQTAWEVQGDVDAVVIQWRGDGERFVHGTTINRNTMLVAGTQMAAQSVNAEDWIERSLQKQVSLVVFDEAHHSIAPTYRELIENIVTANGAKRGLLGLSATPGRAYFDESEALAAMYDGRKVGIGNGTNPVRYLMDKGYLARAKFSTHSFSGSPKPKTRHGGTGDYSDAALSALGQDKVRNSEIVKIVRKLLDEGHRRVIVFAPSVSSADQCADMMRNAGDRFRHAFMVSGTTPPEHRNHYIRTFSNSVTNDPRPLVMFNCNVLTAGFDAPEISAAVIGKPTKSAVRLQQMIGRALRGPKSQGTEDAEIHMLIDETYAEFVDLAELFCLWEDLWEPND